MSGSHGSSPESLQLTNFVGCAIAGAGAIEEAEAHCASTCPLQISGSRGDGTASLRATLLDSNGPESDGAVQHCPWPSGSTDCGGISANAAVAERPGSEGIGNTIPCGAGLGGNGLGLRCSSLERLLPSNSTGRRSVDMGTLDPAGSCDKVERWLLRSISGAGGNANWGPATL